MQAVLPTIRDRQERRRQAAYLALRLAVIFEAFGAECANKNAQNDHAESYPDQEYPDWDLSLPELGTFPDNQTAWFGLNAISPDLAAKALEFPATILASSSAIDWCMRFYDDQRLEITQIEVSRRGLAAWNLAQKLRAKFRLAAADTAWHWPDLLEATLKEALAVEAKRRDRQRARHGEDAEPKCT